MAVPAHDSRDQEFALVYDIPILPVVKQDDEGCSEGTIINSSNVTTGLDINGLSCEEAASKVIEWAEKTGNGKKKVIFSVDLNLNIAGSFDGRKEKWVSMCL